MLDDFIEGLAILFFAVFGVFIAVLLIWAIPATIVGMRVEKACLEQGYPNSSVTWDFQGYCMNMEGAVTIRVEKQ